MEKILMDRNDKTSFKKELPFEDAARQ